ncbi:AraC family transcriptional regulator [Pelagicoccus sp. SDUM812003]|uniref:AraC family transcriptional regulator n=1 Tax=Pelagicoccus sp. SDUM812003 TaxID=3041267 RepID=UPI00280C8AEB|nr:AraC family transcriptional regulator [Pelagicoccus sp. SDUM812003]MDQ8203575.1 AraC family transcriptional regulator [Pelagicoccus sp. SDUM812003]
MKRWTVALPSEKWARWVEYFWLTEASEEGTFEVIPDGRFDLGIVLSRQTPRFVAYGVATKPRLLSMEAGVRYAGVRLRPGAPLVSELAGLARAKDDELSLTKIAGVAASDLVEGFPAGESASVVEPCLSPVLDRSIGKGNSDTIWIRRATDRIIGSRGTMRIEDLADALGVSRRFLELVFKRSLGISPKAFSKITRLGALANRIRAIEGNWSGVASDFGFSDQAHMNRDVSNMTGYTPRRFQERVELMPPGWAGGLD